VEATRKGSPSRHILPSPPPSHPPLRVPSHRPRFELWVLPRMPVVNAAEAELASALVGGSRSPVSPDQVLDYMSLHFQVSADKVRVHRFW
jgi:hypothetical protein